jgi:leader peptidase (prepilin peptidase) / N-methyltransferase
MAERILIIILGVMLLFCAIQDLIKRRVYVSVIGIGAVLTLICLPFTEHIGIADCIGGFSIGLAVILLSKITEGRIGMGDGGILCITGLGLGFWSNLELFGIALFLAAILSIILIVFRRVDRKMSIPFIPFLFAGYIIMFATTKGTMV